MELLQFSEGSKFHPGIWNFACNFGIRKDIQTAVWVERPMKKYSVEGYFKFCYDYFIFF